jgi:HSP20 family protein
MASFGYMTPYRRGGGLSHGRGGGTGSMIFDLHRQMNRMFDDLFEHEGQGGDGGHSAGGFGFPAIDVAQDDKKIEICAELPGVKEGDIDLNLEDGMLTLSGEKRSSREDKETGYSERSFGRFERRISLPSDADEEHCSADFKDGVLTVTIPRSEQKSRARRIPLGASKSSGAESALIDQDDKAKGAQQSGKQSGAEADKAKH